MQKVLLALILSCTALLANAQTETSDIKDYNRVGLSYNNTHYGYNNAYGSHHNDNNFSMNGIGIEYIHGCSITKSNPFFLEVGVGFGASFHNDSDVTNYMGVAIKEKYKLQDFSMHVPINITYRFNIARGMYINPFVGITGKLHFAFRYKEIAEFSGETVETKWQCLFSHGTWGSNDLTWNRCQLGWQIGAGYEYKSIYIGVQWGTDFIGAYKNTFKYDNTGTTFKISTSNLKCTLAYTF